VPLPGTVYLADRNITLLVEPLRLRQLRSARVEAAGPALRVVGQTAAPGPLQVRQRAAPVEIQLGPGQTGPT
jgi:hypothetical protein